MQYKTAIGDDISLEMKLEWIYHTTRALTWFWYRVIHIKPTAAKIAARITPGSRVIPGCKAWAADEPSPPSLSLSEAAVSPGAAAAAFAVRRLAFIDVENFGQGGLTGRSVVVIIVVAVVVLVVVRGSRCGCSSNGGGGYLMLVRSVHQGEDRCALPVEALSLSLSLSLSESLVAEVMAEVMVPAVEMLFISDGYQSEGRRTARHHTHCGRHARALIAVVVVVVVVITGARSISAASHHGRRQGSCPSSQLHTSHSDSTARTVADPKGVWRRVSDIILVVVVVIVGVLGECKGCKEREKNFGEMHLWGKEFLLRCLGVAKAARYAVKEVSR